MHPNQTVQPILRILSSSQLLLGLTLVLVLTASVPVFLGSPSARASVMTPVLVGKVVFTNDDLVSIHGEGFSPGGLVQIVFNNQLGEPLQYTPAWTVASAEAHGPHGSQDPTRGYVPAGSFTEIINLAADIIYGPNGSQDPALGYQPGIPAGSLLAAGNITVRAFDQQTGLWSNQVAIESSGLTASQEQGPIHYDVPQACVAFISCNRTF